MDELTGTIVSAVDNDGSIEVWNQRHMAQASTSNEANDVRMGDMMSTVHGVCGKNA